MLVSMFNLGFLGVRAVQTPVSLPYSLNNHLQEPCEVTLFLNPFPWTSASIFPPMPWCCALKLVHLLGLCCWEKEKGTQKMTQRLKAPIWAVQVQTSRSPYVLRGPWQFLDLALTNKKKKMKEKKGITTVSRNSYLYLPHKIAPSLSD